MTALRKPMVQAALLLLALQVAHTVDHLIGHPSDAIGQIPGYLGYVTNLGILFLAWRDDRNAPLAAVAVGLLTAGGLVAIHLAPHWGVLSDPYTELSLPFVSWAIVFANIGAALWLAYLGFRGLRTAPQVA